MKYVTLSIILIISIMVFVSPANLRADQRSLMAALENADAVQAVALANEWRWTNRDIKTAVDARKIVFKFPDGQVKTVPMPLDKMLVAVAPYLTKTHT
ncbi:MAG: hypothetical protein AB1427_11620 [Thermodesulfobacteriota bacterium]